MSTLPVRIETKYCVNEHDASAVFQLASLFLPRDGASPTAQRITSLYLDSPALTFLAWQRQRAVDRFKLRLRRYGVGAAPIVYAEIKHKHHGIVHKRRAALPAPAIDGLLARPQRLCPAAAALPSLDEFLVRQRAYAAVPQVLVRCEREAVRGSGADAALGVTIDRAVEYQRVRTHDFADCSRGWRCLPLPFQSGSTAIVELKHGPQPPEWMSGIMQRLKPWQRSFSKYAAAMERVINEEQGRP